MIGATQRRRALDALRHPVSQNALALYLVQLAVSLLPLVTLPYLARVLGPHELGVVVFCQSFSWMLLLVVEFGFGASATRAIARRRDDPEAIAATVAAVQGAKLALSGVATAGAVVGLLAVPILRERPGYWALALGTALAQGVDPTWFFTGIERLRLVSSLEVANRAIAAGLTFLLVRDSGDGWVVLALWGLGNLATTAAGTVLLYRRVPLRLPKRGGVRWALAESWKLFVGGTAITLYTSANVFFLGVLSTTTQAAYFATAEKLVRAAPRLFAPIATATYPRVGHLLARGEEERARRLTRLTLALLVGLALAVTLVLVGLAGPIVDLLYGPRFAPSVGVLRILALTLPPIAFSTGLAQLVLLARGHDREAVVVVVAAGLTNVVLALVLAPRYGAHGMAWGLLAVETLAAAGNVVALARIRHRARTAASRGK